MKRGERILPHPKYAEKRENEIHQCLLKSETALSPNRALAFLLIKSVLLKNMWVEKKSPEDYQIQKKVPEISTLNEINW